MPVGIALAQISPTIAGILGNAGHYRNARAIAHRQAQ